MAHLLTPVVEHWLGYMPKTMRVTMTLESDDDTCKRRHNVDFGTPTQFPRPKPGRFTVYKLWSQGKGRGHTIPYRGHAVP